MRLLEELSGTDAVPEDGCVLSMTLHGKASLVVSAVKALGGAALKEGHLGGAGHVALVRLRLVDVSRVDAAHVPNAREEAGGS